MRLFVAVNLPDSEKQRLARLIEQLCELSAPVRWIDAESLHITLQFLGNVPDTEVPKITTALDRSVQNYPSFDVDVSGFGAFPSLSRPRIFWIGVEPVKELLDLQKNVERELEHLNFEPEARDYSPHVTIGRTQNDGRVDRAAVDRMKQVVEYKTRISVESVDLMRSHLGRDGARYERIHAARLRG